MTCGYTYPGNTKTQLMYVSLVELADKLAWDADHTDPA